MEHTFSAFVVREVDGSYEGIIETKHVDDLPEGDVLIRVTYSCVNYKDALSMSGNRGVTKSYPHTPGVDAAGYIEQTTDARFQTGQAVVVNGFDFGMNTSGGFQEYIRVPAEWVTPLPEAITPLEAMRHGTAGLTAAQSIDELSRIVSKEAGPILVTGATGGVGTIAIALLIRLGYTVHAVTGKRTEQERLLEKGVAEVLDRAMFLEETERPLKKGTYAGVIDTVGGPLLASVIRFVQYGGVVTTCGNVGGAEMTLTVYPFILRGVRLIGIDAVQTPIAYREKLWQRLANEWQVSLASEVDVKALKDLPEIAEALLTSRHRGRTVIEI
ncbi:quinone oxidoreductase [Exiguobacterium sp. BMC-KP]|uniref:YhdH/YhfP family quinone oxidoreductase n=1 Tax=Exiguobacterium sp. BMC-KP TaxID=1684312 RepID=UPI0006AA3633|nr:YhdH/YhfP family quinone oxidoreductase [Exiguobacterium sp. BMC-KP]KOP31237.1 quinone oxidoreductase [Exiguobacterium sp. BMC-KP]